MDNRAQIRTAFEDRDSGAWSNELQKAQVEAEYWKWVDRVFEHQERAMSITFVLYANWFFTIQHIYEAVFAAKNKRAAHFVLLENVLDFWIMVQAMLYTAVVYKVYRWDTFLTQPGKEQMARLYFDNFDAFTLYVDD
jgi:hypothetical protein